MDRTAQIEASYDGPIPEHLRRELKRVRPESVQPIDTEARFLALAACHREDAIRCAQAWKKYSKTSPNFASDFKAGVIKHRRIRLGLLAKAAGQVAAPLMMAAE